MPVKIYPECYNCFITQAIRSSRIHTQDTERILDVVQAVVKVLVDIDHNVPPPLISEYVYGTIRRKLGVDDPYGEIKKRYNDIAMGYLEFAMKRLESSDDPLECALKLSLAGNIIDFGSEVKRFDIMETINQTVNEGFDLNDIESFKKQLKRAKNLVLIADNAGEAVFDRVLLETIGRLYPSLKIHVFVRGGPIINDVTIDDAKYIGLDRVAHLVKTHRPIPGFWPAYCEDECKRIYDECDLIISKGQGNFETLTEIKDERVFFLFIVKCRVVANYLGVKKYAKIFKQNRGR